MATMKKGVLIRSPQWWRHLRSFKAVFWRKHRKAERREGQRQYQEWRA